MIRDCVSELPVSVNGIQRRGVAPETHSTQNSFLLSSRMVTGPSLMRETDIVA